MALVPLGTSSNSWVLHSNAKYITAFKKPKNSFKTISSLKHVKTSSPKIEMVSPVSHVLEQTKEKQERINLTTENMVGEINHSTIPSKKKKRKDEKSGSRKKKKKREVHQSTISRLMQERMRQSNGGIKGRRGKSSEEKNKKKKKKKKDQTKRKSQSIHSKHLKRKNKK